MKKFFWFLICFLCGCSHEKEVSFIEKFNDLTKDKEYIIIDVRTKEEYDSEKVVGAINIPYDSIDENIEIEKDKIIFVYCQSGKRSKIAYQKLSDLGYTVYDLGQISTIELEKE